LGEVRAVADDEFVQVVCGYAYYFHDEQFVQHTVKQVKPRF
jgi:hypothetical protein